MEGWRDGGMEGWREGTEEGEGGAGRERRIRLHSRKTVLVIESRQTTQRLISFRFFLFSFGGEEWVEDEEDKERVEGEVGVEDGAEEGEEGVKQ